MKKIKWFWKLYNEGTKWTNPIKGTIGGFSLHVVIIITLVSFLFCLVPSSIIPMKIKNLIFGYDQWVIFTILIFGTIWAWYFANYMHIYKEGYEIFWGKYKSGKWSWEKVLKETEKSGLYVPTMKKYKKKWR